MKRQDDYLTKYTQRALERISEPNRSTIRQYLLFKEQVGQKPSTLASAVGVMVAMDRVVEGKRLTELTPDDLRAAVAAYATDHKPNCVLTFCAVLQAFYRWRYDDAIPPAIAKALKRKTRPIQPPARVVSEQEFRMLLDAARDARSKPQQLRDQAILWTLWYGGFRISEMMSLRVSDLTFRDAGVELKLRELSPRLKTGARTIFLVEAAGALRLWLALHPYGDDPEAPLFPFDRQSPLHTTTVRIMVRNLCKDTGVKHVHPHAFRHTRATRNPVGTKRSSGSSSAGPPAASTRATTST